MPSFLIRNLARIFALSQMEKSQYSTLSDTDDVDDGVSIWNKYMRWLVPFVHSSGYRVIIENPKSHEKIVIDQDTKAFPRLTSSWLRRFDEKELRAWMEENDKKEEARKIAETRCRAMYGDGYKVTDKDIQDVLNEFKATK